VDRVLVLLAVGDRRRAGRRRDGGGRTGRALILDEQVLADRVDQPRDAGVRSGPVTDGRAAA
jgi:hypothetical protein